MLDILISQYVSEKMITILIALGVIYVFYRVIRAFNRDMQWVYNEYNKLVDENDKLQLENTRLKDENAKLNVQVLKSLDKLDIERTK